MSDALGCVVLHFPEQHWQPGDVIVPNWACTTVRDAETGDILIAVTEFCLRMNADGAAEVVTLQFVSPDGTPLSKQNTELALDEDKAPVTREFTYLLAGVLAGESDKKG